MCAFAWAEHVCMGAHASLIHIGTHMAGLAFGGGVREDPIALACSIRCAGGRGGRFKVRRVGDQHGGRGGACMHAPRERTEAAKKHWQLESQQQRSTLRGIGSQSRMRRCMCGESTCMAVWKHAWGSMRASIGGIISSEPDLY